MFDRLREKAAAKAAAADAESKKYWTDRREREAQEIAETRGDLEHATSEELYSRALDSMVSAEISHSYPVHSEYSREVMITEYSRAAALGALATIAKLREAEE